MASFREFLCAGYAYNYSAEWAMEIPKIPECELYISFPMVLLAYALVVSLPYLLLLFRGKSTRRRCTKLLFLKNVLFMALLALSCSKIAMCSISSSRTALSVFQPSSLCGAGVSEA
nr:unnamed protein product [Spirometra erinaceieuropaei]